MIAERTARCRCGQLTAMIRGEPVRVSVCHCLECRRRTGGPFSAQARFPIADVDMTGEYRVWAREGGSGSRAFYRWCPDCGATVAYTNENMDGVIAIPLGAFDDYMPMPGFSVYENRKPDWIEIVGDGIVHD